MITWFARSTAGWWSSTLAEVTRAIDDLDTVWEPFLTDDDVALVDQLPTI